ncbi:MAG: glycosyltransferase family 4 protein [Nitrospiraceae bacterium]|nr:glycosyltransferase family 4 protein [Nitrospiraceae bacterium]
MGIRPLTVMNLVSGDGRGGADRLALDLSKGLKRRGHRVIWGCPSIYYLMDEVLAAGLETYAIDFSGNMDMSPLVPFLRFCRAEKVDIVNVHHSHGRHLLVAARLLCLKSKAVFTRHCISGSTPYIGACFYNLVLDMNIAVSDVVRQSLLRGGIWPEKVVTVYGGIDSKNFDEVPSDKVEEIRKKYSGNGKFTIGIVARTGLHGTPRGDKPSLKRHEVLFKALADIGGDITVLVLGACREEEIESLKLIAGHNGLDPTKLLFAGFQNTIAPFYKIMDLKVLPSPNEGLGLVIIEAMAAGVPCIGADSGGIREIITDGVDGLLFRHGDSRELAEKIRIMRDDKTKRDLFVSNGREKVKRFDIRRTVEETERVFYGLLERK